MISIIIPAHNERENLERLLPYLGRLRSPRPVEVIVALSCETKDGPYDFADAPSVRLVECPGKGRALQMNAAVEKTKGDVLVFLHADVMPPLSFFQDIVQALDEGHAAGFFSYKFDKDSLLLKINASFTAKDGIFTGGGDQCLFIKKSVFLALGGFNEEQVLMEDFEFFNRMKRHQINYKIIKKDLIVSSRKYGANSYLRVNLTNLLLVVLFKFGYPSKKLKILHNKLLRVSYKTNT